MTTEKPRYQYVPLDDERPLTTRLLRLYRDDKKTLCGQLQAFNLDSKDCPRFSSLSYTWGPPHYANIIHLDGHDFPVLDSLWPFMNTLCDNFEFRRDQWLWIDSICINQEDLQERSSQVQHMKRIFAQSKRTIAWLGEASPEILMGIKFMSHLAQCHNAIMKYSNSHGTREVPPKFRQPERWRALGQFLEMRWWRRMWTLQEYVMPTNLSLYCGKKRIEMHTLETALSAIWFCEPDSSLIRPGAWGLAWTRLRVRQWNHTSEYSEHIGLVALLAYTSSCELTDPRDRVYGLLGLANKTDRLMVGRPDYNASVADVYKRLVISFIETHRSLDIICFAQTFRQPFTITNGATTAADPRPSDDSLLPSWVPDWRVHTEPFVTPALVSQTASLCIGNFRPISYDAWNKSLRDASYSADLRAAPKFSIDLQAGELTCWGYYVGEIDGIGTTLNSPDHLTVSQEAPPITQSTSQYNVPSAEGRRPLRKSREPLFSVVRCLTLDRKDRYLAVQAPGGAFMRQFLDLIILSRTAEPRKLPARCRSALAWYNVNKHLLLQGWTLEQLCLDLIDTDEVQSNAHAVASEESFASRLIDCTSPLAMKRRLMTMTDGSLGMVPPDARKGDIICIFLGCSVPVVLRRRDAGDEERYWLIGECYAHGIMNGEFLDQGKSVRSFVLV